MMQGRFDDAATCQRRAEQLELLDGATQALPGTVVRLEAAAYWMVGDLVRLKESIERIAELATVFPKWQNTLAMAKSHYRRLQGDGEGALETIAPTLAVTGPGADPDWVWVTSTHVHALVACGRHAEAAAAGRKFLATCREQGLVDRSLIQPLCEALTKNGEPMAARDLMDSAIAELQAQGVTGLWLGGFYEARAYTAIALEDPAGFEKFAELCAAEYRRGKNSTLVANYERLMESARCRAFGVSAALQQAADYSVNQSGPSASGTTVRGFLSHLQNCASRTERVACALGAICDEMGAAGGHLFGFHGGQLVHLGSLPSDLPLPDDLPAILEQYVTDCTGDAATQSVALASRLPGLTTSSSDFQPTLILTDREGALAVAAVAALQRDSADFPGSTQLLRIVGNELQAHKDVEPVLLIS
jgi:hypothetical protein